MAVPRSLHFLGAPYHRGNLGVKVNIASRNSLLTVQERLSGYRLLDEGFDPVRHAIALPRGRESGLAFAAGFVKDIKASGVVAAAIARYSMRGINVAPAATR